MSTAQENTSIHTESKNAFHYANFHFQKLILHIKKLQLHIFPTNITNLGKKG